MLRVGRLGPENAETCTFLSGKSLSFPGHLAVRETATRVSAFGRRLGGKRSCLDELHPQAKRSCEAGNQKGIQTPDSIKGLAGLEGVAMPSCPWSLLTAPRSKFRQILQRNQGPRGCLWMQQGPHSPLHSPSWGGKEGGPGDRWLERARSLLQEERESDRGSKAKAQKQSKARGTLRGRSLGQERETWPLPGIHQVPLIRHRGPAAARSLALRLRGHSSLNCVWTQKASSEPSGWIRVKHTA